jgi:hypothetical protein
MGMEISMKETSNQKLIASFRRTQRNLDLRFITPMEYMNWVLLEFSEMHCTAPEVIPTLWKLIPENVRCEFHNMIRRAALPGFRWQPFWIGPGRSSMTEDEIRRDDDLRLGRIRVWAEAFVRFWDVTRANESE